MLRPSTSSTVFLSVLLNVVGTVVLAADASHESYILGQPVTLDEDDLGSITLQVMKKYPLLASSPGIKAVSAQRSVRSTDIASIIYFPHTESSGLKQAFQVRCVRHISDEHWACDEVEIRRYLKLESQDFEVRVTGDISTDAALAVIQASRGLAREQSREHPLACETAIQILPDGDGSYLVGWGAANGQGACTVRARLKHGGNPLRVEGWQTTVFEPN